MVNEVLFVKISAEECADTQSFFSQLCLHGHLAAGVQKEAADHFDPLFLFNQFFVTSHCSKEERSRFPMNEMIFTHKNRQY